MSLQELLNADVSSLGARLREGWSWWIAELGEMVPRRLHEGSGSARPLAELSEGDPVRVWRKGRFAERIEGQPARTIAADVGLPRSAVLTRELVLPALRPAELRRLLANDLSRFTPFEAEQVYFDLTLLEKDEGRGRQAARLAVIPRSRAEAALARAERLRISPRRIGVLREDRTLEFDFLAPMRQAGHGGRARRPVALWWTAAAGLAAVNCAILIVKDVDDVAALEGAVELQAPTVKLAMALRGRVETEQAARAALLDRRDRGEPLRILDAAARAFPPPQWVQRLEWNGRSVRLVGYGEPGFDVLAAMAKLPELSQPRQISSGQSAATGALKPFDVTAGPAEPRR
jgi:general secretion pathway protein L